jgi:hypothetical protein
VNTHGSDVQIRRSGRCFLHGCLRPGAAIIVIVLQRRRDHTLADTSARLERLQIDAARLRRGAVDNRRRRCGVRANIFDAFGDGTRGACGSESRKANEEADADMNATGAVEGVVDAMSTLRPRCGVAPGYGGVGVTILVGADGCGCIAARFAAGLAAGGSRRAFRLRSALGEPEPVEPSAG